MVKNITEMCEALKMNTAISEIMIFVNELKKVKTIDNETWKGFVKVIAPFMPFVAEELWQEINGLTSERKGNAVSTTWDKQNSVHWQTWPEFDKTEDKNSTIELPVMINGKVRGQIMTDPSDTEETVRAKVISDTKLAKYVGGKSIVKLVFVKGKIVSIRI